VANHTSSKTSEGQRCVVEEVVEGCDKTMKRGLGSPETFGTLSFHSAYDSCVSGATFQKSTPPMETSHNLSSSFLCIHPACEVHEVEKRRLGREDLLIFAFFSRSSMLGILPGPQAPTEAKATLPERQRSGKSKHTLPPASQAAPAAVINRS
jgi:hypothetical protein